MRIGLDMFVLVNIIIFITLMSIFSTEYFREFKESLFKNELFHIIMNMFYGASFITTCIIIEIILFKNNVIDFNVLKNCIEDTLFLFILNVIFFLINIFFLSLYNIFIFFKNKLFKKKN